MRRMRKVVLERPEEPIVYSGIAWLTHTQVHCLLYNLILTFHFLFLFPVLSPKPIPETLTYLGLTDIQMYPAIHVPFQRSQTLPWATVSQPFQPRCLAIHHSSCQRPGWFPSLNFANRIPSHCISWIFTQEWSSLRPWDAPLPCFSAALSQPTPGLRNASLRNQSHTSITQ